MFSLLFKLLDANIDKNKKMFVTYIAKKICMLKKKMILKGRH